MIDKSPSPQKSIFKVQRHRMLDFITYTPFNFQNVNFTPVVLDTGLTQYATFQI